VARPSVTRDHRVVRELTPAHPIADKRLSLTGDRDTEAAIEARLGRKLPPGWEEQFTPLYDETFAAELAPVEGVLEALDRIAVPSCIASSGTREYLRHMLGLTGLYERFAGRIFSVEDVASGKPARTSSSPPPTGWEQGRLPPGGALGESLRRDPLQDRESLLDVGARFLECDLVSQLQRRAVCLSFEHARHEGRAEICECQGIEPVGRQRRDDQRLVASAQRLR